MCGTTSMTASNLSFKVTMSPSWLMASLGRANRTPWEPLARQSRTMHGSWVSRVGLSGAGQCPRFSTTLYEYVLTRRLPGVIPRAASVLFQKLQGPPALNRSGSSSLRAPTRYSLASPQSSSQNVTTMAKLATERNWQMKATYVEVRGAHTQENNSDRLDRYTTSNYAIS